MPATQTSDHHEDVVLTGLHAASHVHTVQGPSTSTTTQVTSFDGTTVARLVITFVGGKQRVCTYDMTSQSPPTCTGP